jgi:hypothetical protein
LPPSLDMLTISNDVLPNSDLAYLAFRVAFFDTLERISLADQVGMQPDASFGFLTEVPFLRYVPPHVQLDLLLSTWAKHVDPAGYKGDLVDESVIYAACETAARVVKTEQSTAKRFFRNGPRPVALTITRQTSNDLEALHFNLSNQGDFLLISQFLDIPPDEARPLKAKFGINEQACECMFDVLGRWYVSPSFRGNAASLLTLTELDRAANVLRLPQAQKA